MAISTDTHVIAMPHKCGSSYVMRVLESAFGAKKILEDRHVPMSRIPKDALAGKRVLGIVRNPFHWYVSRWYYVTKTIRKLPSFRNVLEREIYDDQGVFGIRPKDVEKPPYIGSFTWQHVMFHSTKFWRFVKTGDAVKAITVDHVMRLENIAKELKHEFGEDITGHLKQWRNSYAAADWRKYLDRHCIELICEADGQLIEHYGYSP